MTFHLMSAVKDPDPRPETIARGPSLEEKSRTTEPPDDQLAHLAQSERMLRAAMEALSPDMDEIRNHLANEAPKDAAGVGRYLDFRLVVAVVVLVFLILGLDLLLAGA